MSSQVASLLSKYT